MSLSANLTINMYSVMILLIIFIQTMKSTEKNLLQQKYFVWILLVTALMLVMDIFSRFDGYPGTLYAAANQVGNFLIFLLSPILPSLWLLYTHSQVDDGTCEKRRWLWLLPVLSAANAVTLIISQFLGWLYTIGADNIYHRGPLYWLPVSVTIILMAAAFALVIAYRKKIERKHFISLLLFPVPPLLCIMLQITYYGTSLILNGVALSILIIFITIQNQHINTDYLTGAYNRKGLETYINQKISASTENKTFAAMLLDLDDFKSINDSFGHNTGDRVLATTTNLLKSCLRSDDFIARFGGDEFYIILNISRPDELEAVSCRIRDCFKRYNESSAEPFKISFSMGYAVYDYHSHLNAEAFHEQLDSLMYANKRIGKNPTI